jgi:hypothetical protein
MENFEISFCPKCHSQVRFNDGQFIGYNNECICIEGLEKDEAITFSIPSENLKQIFGFVMRENNTLVTYFEAIKMNFKKIDETNLCII